MTVYVLRHAHRNFDTEENLGVYDSADAMLEGLATAIAANHQDDHLMDVAKAVAHAVYDFMSVSPPLPKSGKDGCRDGDSAYGWESYTLLESERKANDA